jgi:hypothetical protein
MKVKDHASYNSEFPETFTWEWLDSIALTNITTVIVNHIEHDLRRDRNYVPGLRAALNIIADVAEITSGGLIHDQAIR